MSLTRFRLLSFACYGTLIDRDSGVAAALRPLALRAGLAIGRAELLAQFDRHEAAALAAGSGRPYADLLGEAHRELAREWGAICPDEDHLLFARSVAHWPAFADSAGALQYLQRYFRIFVITNADRDSIRASIRRLDARVDAIVAAEDVGSYKPDRRAFEALLARAEKLGVAAAQTLHVAHSLPHDLEPARAAGIACAWVDRVAEEPREPPREDPRAREFEYAFRSLAELVMAHQADLRA